MEFVESSLNWRKNFAKLNNKLTNTFLLTIKNLNVMAQVTRKTVKVTKSGNTTTRVTRTTRSNGTTKVTRTVTRKTR